MLAGNLCKGLSSLLRALEPKKTQHLLGHLLWLLQVPAVPALFQVHQLRVCDLVGEALGICDVQDLIVAAPEDEGSHGDILHLLRDRIAARLDEGDAGILPPCSRVCIVLYIYMYIYIYIYIYIAASAPECKNNSSAAASSLMYCIKTTACQPS